ncbi:hypothetical protein [Halomonas koreensis]|uniref:FlgO domain-containing protein n=1 Tax=Halomonas koreensis TaxID=245385 RepID=A0ABU1G7E5_9GAMM|nr:hypothetical protein [Halomonas koreensis]MDR5868478.1 hypothetical protein [Halomonas koreensis]
MSTPRRIARTCLVLALATLQTGCLYRHMTQAPVATTYPYSEQQRMQAAHHWAVLARHEADGLLDSERLRFHPLYVAPAEPEGDFARGYRALLTSELVSRGAPVTLDPAGALELRFDAQLVHHRDRDTVRPPEGALTALAAGVAVATVPFNHWAEPALALVPAAAGADLVAGSWTRTGDQEVIITTQVVDGDRVLYSSSNLYYVNRGDRGQYAPHQAMPAPASPRIAVSDQW